MRETKRRVRGRDRFIGNSVGREVLKYSYFSGVVVKRNGAEAKLGFPNWNKHWVFLRR
jgi:hypothetical protein